MEDFPVLTTDYTGSSIRVESLPFSVKRLVLARPLVRNALNEAMMDEIQQVLDLLGGLAVEELRLLLLQGEGEHFCAGADIGYMKEQAGRGLAESFNDARRLAQLFFSLASFPTPVLAAVRGAAIGGGLGLTVCSDFVLAEENARFATTEVRLGILPAVIGPYIVRKIGVGNAAPLMLSGRGVSARDALATGLVQRVAPAEPTDFASALQAVLLDFLRAGPQAARRAKELLKRVYPLPGPELFDFTAQTIAEARSSEEGQIGLQSFFDKTAPPWSAEVEEIQNRSRRSS
jgi:methylglutaconyl-CoA hydratase